MHRTHTGAAVLMLHYTADPEMAESQPIARLRAQMSQAWWSKEMEGNADALHGQRVFPEFSRALHSLKADQINYIDKARGIRRKMTRYMALDPHPRTPHFALWVGIDQWSDWYVYREMWPSIAYASENTTVSDSDEENSFTVRDYAETIARYEGASIEWHNAETDQEYGIYRRGKGEHAERVVERFMDQAGKGFRASGEAEVMETYAERYHRFGLSFADPYKAHRAGEDAIKELLRERHHDMLGKWPRLHISEDCEELMLEMENYRFQRTNRPNPERELKQKGVEARCHGIDTLRYLATADIQFIKSMES